jgi:hypothetical protein
MIRCTTAPKNAGLSLEAMIERSLGDSRAGGNRCDACRAIAMGQKLFSGHVENTLPELR